MTTEERGNLAKAAVEYGESFKTGEWFETIRIDAFIAGAEWHRKQEHPGSEPDSGPVSSGTPCTFNIDNPDRVEPL